MGSETHYDQDGSDRRKHRRDDDYKDSSDRDRASKRSHRDRDEPESYKRRDGSKERDQDRHRRRRRSRSPESRSHKSHDRRRRDSRSPVEKESRRERRTRRSADDPDEGDSTRSRRRIEGDEDRHGRKRRHQDSSAGEEDKAEKQVSVKRGGPLPSQSDQFAVATGDEPEVPKEKPNFGTTGALAAASNSVTQADGTVITLKYHEPAEARKPPARDQWKLFVFKGPDVVDTIELSSRSCWLVGRETAVVDLPAEHPSISKQHAVVQFRYTEKRNEFGDKIGRVKPYLIDLESANGTELNGDKVPDRRYLELRPKDVVKFGLSTREYVVMLSRD